MSNLDLKRKFLVINGGGRKPSAWLDIPQTIIGLSTETKSRPMTYRIAVDSVRKALEMGHRQPLLDLWSLVLGKIPPVNCAETKWREYQSALNPMGSAHACFRGIKRPVGDDDNGYDVYAFVTKPQATFKYVPSLSCVIEPVQIPDDLVGVIYVRVDHPHGRKALRGASTAISRGVVTHWELVEADETGLLPIEWETRYRTRKW